MQRKPRIAVIGARLGGTAAASLLQKADYNVKLHEQAPSFCRIGAGIHLGPSAMKKVMRKIGIDDALNAQGLPNNAWLRGNRNPDWCFGYDVFNVPLTEPREIATAHNDLAAVEAN